MATTLMAKGFTPQQRRALNSLVRAAHHWRCGALVLVETVDSDSAMGYRVDHLPYGIFTLRGKGSNKCIVRVATTAGPYKHRGETYAPAITTVVMTYAEAEKRGIA